MVLHLQRQQNLETALISGTERHYYLERCSLLVQDLTFELERTGFSIALGRYWAWGKSHEDVRRMLARTHGTASGWAPGGELITLLSG